MMLELATVAVVVSPPPQKAAEWYRDKLGFEVRGEAEGHWVVVAPKGSKTGIHLCESDTLEPGNTGILFLTSDIEAAVKELKARGVKFTQELTKESWGTYAMFADPYGNEYWLMPTE
ncbi:MAG: VOC family protein [Candidatus Bathyarchaeia archaeon]